MDILAALQSEMDKLPKSEQRIAEILFSDLGFATNASITELAARAEVSPPTVTRFCRRIGCNSFSDFKVRLAQSAFVGTRYLRPESKVFSAADAAENVITKAQSALYQLHANLDAELYEMVSGRIARSTMVYAFGSGGNSAMIANELQNRLFRLGLRVTASDDHGLQLMMAATVKPSDVVIGSSITGNDDALVKALQAANGYKAHTVAITRPGSPVAAAADSVLPIDLPEGINILRPTSTRFAFLAAIDILALLVAMRIEGGAVETLRRIKHQLVTHRDKHDREPMGD